VVQRLNTMSTTGAMGHASSGDVLSITRPLLSSRYLLSPR
jgi:hypothetical protein